MILKNIPGGNIQVLEQRDYDIYLSEEQRDSSLEWFYWKFRALFSKAGHYTFHFKRPNKVGTRGACVSHDCGLTWHWQGSVTHENAQEFSYDCPGPEEVWFCQAMPYMQSNWEAFLKEFAGNPCLKSGTLCKSRKGRAVEYSVVQEGEAPNAILLTARHHAQESMASYVLEGFLREILKDTDFARDFRRAFRVYAVPFTDKDGVEDGDQGKGRIPRDHARDYCGESIYPETAAIRSLVETEKPFLVLDLHCPWLRYGITNEHPYLVENKFVRQRIEVERFAKILESLAPACAPFRASDTNRFAVGWNTSANAKVCTIPGYALHFFCSQLDFVRLAASLENPFANFGDATVEAPEARAFGTSIAHAAVKYHESICQMPSYQCNLFFAGDLICPREQIAACSAVPNGFEQIFAAVRGLVANSDYAVVNLETPLAGKEAGYTSELYSFNAPDALADAVHKAGFRMVSTANNHCLDRGVPGLQRTLTVLDENSLDHVGTARTDEELEKLIVKDINGLKIGFLACTYGTNAFANHCFLKPEEQFSVLLSQPQETLPGSIHLLNSAEKIAEEVSRLPEARAPFLERIRKQIQALKAVSDFVVILLHSGGQYNPEPEAYTQWLATQVAGFAPDIIVANHPHVVQRCTKIKGIPVFFSLGNFSCYPDATPEEKRHPESATSITLNIRLAKDKKPNASFRVMRSILGPNGISHVEPMYPLAQNDATMASEMRSAVRAFLNLSPETEIPLQEEYTIAD